MSGGRVTDARSEGSAWVAAIIPLPVLPAARIPAFTSVNQGSGAASMAGAGHAFGRGVGPEPGEEIEVEAAVAKPGNRTEAPAAMPPVVSETGSAESIHRAKPPANSAGLKPDSAREFEVSREALSGFSVNHVQVEKPESDQWEDSVRESSSGCSSDPASTPWAFPKDASSCSSGDSRNPREGILRTRNSGTGSGLALPADGRPKDFHSALALRRGLPNSKVTESGQQTRDGAGANRHRAIARTADGGLAFSSWLRRVAQEGDRRGARSQAGGPSYRASHGSPFDADPACDGGALVAGYRGHDRRPGPGPEPGYAGHPALADVFVRHGVGEAEAGDREDCPDENSWADSGPLSEVNPLARQGKNPGEIRVANEPENESGIHSEIRGENRPAGDAENRADDVEIRAGDRRPSVAEPPDAGLLMPPPDLRFGRPTGPCDCGEADGIGCEIGGEIARRYDRDFGICSPPSAQAAAAPGDIRTGERPCYCAERRAASVVVGAIVARSDVPSAAPVASAIPASRPTDFCRPARTRGVERVTGFAGLDAGLGAQPSTRAAGLNFAFISNSVRRANSAGENSGAIVLPFRPIRMAKHAGDSGPDPKSHSGIDADGALSGIGANFRENQTAAGYFISGETAADFANSANIRKTELVRNSSPGIESLCDAELIRACDLDFSNFHETTYSGSGEISRVIALALAPIRRTKRFGISSLDTRNRCPADIRTPFGAAAIFEALKLNDFFEPIAEARKHIRRRELFAASSLYAKSRCIAGLSAPFSGGAIFGILKLRQFFEPAGEGEKHIRGGEVFDTSCPNTQTADFRAARVAPYEGDRKVFIFSEFSDNIHACFGAPKHIRKAEQSGTSCPGTPGEFSWECASECLAAGPIWAVNSGECLTEINAEKLPDFSKSISHSASSESITGINADTLPDLAIPGLSESITGINAQSSRESAPINSRESFTGVNARSGDSPFEQTRLADSSIRAFPVRIACDVRVHCDRSPFAPACVCVRRARRRESHPDTAVTPRYRIDSMMAVKSESTVNPRPRVNTEWATTEPRAEIREPRH